MQKLRIVRDDLIQALTFRFELTDAACYLDTETGAILLTGEDADDIPEDIADNPRYLEIEPISAHVSFHIMEAFVATVTDAHAAASLARALEGRKPFRRFKDALLEFPALRQAWFQFENAAHARLAADWCGENGIEVEWT